MIRGRYLTSADDIGAVLDVRRRVALCEGLPATGADEHDLQIVCGMAAAPAAGP